MVDGKNIKNEQFASNKTQHVCAATIQWLVHSIF